MLGPVDPVLLRRARCGDPTAVADLFAVLRPALVRYCRARLGWVDGAHTTADDVAQEACLAVLRALPRYREQGRPFPAFVYAIASHKVVDAQRAAVRDRVTPIGAVPERTDHSAGPEEQALAWEVSRRLSSLLDALPDRQRDIVLLRVVAGLSSEEVGQALGMSAAAVRVAQSRALARLRALAPDALGSAAGR